MISRKQSVVDQTTKGIDYLINRNKTDVFHGVGSFEDSTHIKVTSDKSEVLETKNTKETPSARSPGTAIFLIIFCKFVIVKKYSLVNVPKRQIKKNTKSRK